MALPAYLFLSLILFGIGAFGFLARRNAIMMLICIEVMLNAVNLALVAFNAFDYGAQDDAGAVFSRDAALIDRITRRANHGRAEKYLHDYQGVSSRLDTLQAAILRVKLRHLDAWNAARRAHAETYRAHLADLVHLPTRVPDSEHVYHVFALFHPHRDALASGLHEAGIGTAVHYPLPVHLQPAFASLGYHAGDLPHSEVACRETLSLPIYPELTLDQQRRVIQSCATYLRKQVRRAA